MTITPARQKNSVSQGVALGLLMCGYDAIGGNKVSVDLAFEGAWRIWPQRTTFPTVDNALSKYGGGTRLVTHADGAKHAWAFYWESSGPNYEFRTRITDWSVDDPDDVEHAIRLLDGDVTAEQWRELAEAFIVRMNR